MSRRISAPTGVDVVAEPRCASDVPGAASFVHRIQPTWGDADPARMIYTGRYPDYALRAIDAWLLAHVGAGFYQLNEDWGIGTPFVHLECDFRSPATPRDVLMIAVGVEAVGKTSLTFRVAGTVESDGRLCFEGKFVCVTVAAHAQFKTGAQSLPLDPRIRVVAERALAANRSAVAAGGKRGGG